MTYLETLEQNIRNSYEAYQAEEPSDENARAWEEACEALEEFKANSQYPEGTDKLWNAQFRKDRNIGLCDGMTAKLSGTALDAMEQAEAMAEEYNMILQCLSRRY